MKIKADLERGYRFYMESNELNFQYIPISEEYLTDLGLYYAPALTESARLLVQGQVIQGTSGLPFVAEKSGYFAKPNKNIYDAGLVYELVSKSFVSIGSASYLTGKIYFRQNMAYADHIPQIGAIHAPTGLIIKEVTGDFYPFFEVKPTRGYGEFKGRIVLGALDDE